MVISKEMGDMHPDPPADDAPTAKPERGESGQLAFFHLEMGA
jgi:hypothetical protein